MSANQQTMLQLAATELSAARSLYAQGLLQQAALHLHLFWRSAPMSAPPGEREGQAWEESVEVLERLATRELTGALEVPGEPGLLETRRIKGLLDLQLQGAGAAYRAARRDASVHHEASAPIPWERGRLLDGWGEPGHQVRTRLARGLVQLLVGLCALAFVGLMGLLIAGSSSEESSVFVPAPPPPPVLPPVPADAWATLATPRSKDSPPDKTVTLARVMKRQRPGAPWDAPGSVIFDVGVQVTLPIFSRAGAVEVSLGGNDRYLLSFLRGEKVLGAVTVGPASAMSKSLRVVTVNAPGEALARGYGAVKVIALEGDGFFSLGHLRLVD